MNHLDNFIIGVLSFVVLSLMYQFIPHLDIMMIGVTVWLLYVEYSFENSFVLHCRKVICLLILLEWFLCKMIY